MRFWYVIILIFIGGCWQVVHYDIPAATSRPVQFPATPHAVLTLGTSVSGVPLQAWAFGDPSREPVLIMAAMHGNEPASAMLANRLLVELQHSREWSANHYVVVWPVVNPDGLAGNRRQNAHGVDINRNFPAKNWKKQSKKSGFFGGDAPATEPETLAVMKLIATLKPARICTIHSIGRGEEQNNYDGPAKDLATLMHQHNGYRVSANIGYPTPGSFGSWAGIDQNNPVITLELPTGIDPEVAWKQNGPALRSFINGK